MCFEKEVREYLLFLAISCWNERRWTIDVEMKDVGFFVF